MEEYAGKPVWPVNSLSLKYTCKEEGQFTLQRKEKRKETDDDDSIQDKTRTSSKKKKKNYS